MPCSKRRYSTVQLPLCAYQARLPSPTRTRPLTRMLLETFSVELDVSG